MFVFYDWPFHIILCKECSQYYFPFKFLAQRLSSFMGITITLVVTVVKENVWLKIYGIIFGHRLSVRILRRFIITIIYISGTIRGAILRASVKFLELGVRTPGGLFLGVWYAADIDFRRFRTPSLKILGVILGLLESK